MESVFYLLDNGLWTGFSLCTNLLSIVSYVLFSLGLYTVAKRRMINHPWLSWIPVANIWILGSLSDQYRYVVRGQNKSKRKVLLTLKIVAVALSVVIVVVCLGAVFNLAAGAVYGMDEEQLFREVFSMLFGVGGLALVTVPVTVVLAVFRYMALYDLYLSFDPENAVLFLVLSIIFAVTEPFFIFFNRQKDRGMPPRAPQQPQQIPTQQAQEPWENPQQ